MKQLVIGITGSVGSGKSTLRKILCDFGAKGINADTIAHEILQQPKLRQQLIEKFGNKICAPKTGINTRELSKVVFSSQAKLQMLTDLLYPLIRKKLTQQIKTLKSNSASPVILEAPTLFEANCQDLVDIIISVEAAIELRQTRCQEQRQWKTMEINQRDKALITEGQRREKVSLVIENNHSLQQLKQEAKMMWKKIIMD